MGSVCFVENPGFPSCSALSVHKLVSYLVRNRECLARPHSGIKNNIK